MIRLLIKVLVLFLVSLTSNANLYNCKSIYESCFENIPKDMITYHQEVNSHGIANKNNINLQLFRPCCYLGFYKFGDLYKMDLRYRKEVEESGENIQNASWETKSG